MHSRSPSLHNYWLAKHGLAGSYLPLAIPSDGLDAALRAWPALGFSGCNLTIPHKQAALDIVDKIDPLARRIGAINCIVVARDGSLEGQNHDAFGYGREHLRQVHPGWRSGYRPGGGARRRWRRPGCAGELDRNGARARSVSSTARSRGHASSRRELGKPVSAVPWNDRQWGAQRRRHAGQHHQPGNAGASRRWTSPSTPCRRARWSRTSSTFRARRHCSRPPAARGNPTVNGLGMLLHQARPAFYAWFGIMPEVTPELRAMIEATT